MTSTIEKILRTAHQQSVFRAADIPDTKDPRSTLRRMVRDRQLVQPARGLYALPDFVQGLHHSLVEAEQRYPGGVFCLLSALAFHHIGTQMPYDVWMMRADRKVVPKQPGIRFFYCSREILHVGIEEHTIEGVRLRIYNPARTVADCFKYRNKIGLDVALEALREGWRAHRFTMDELWSAARAVRVQRVMQPYLEMLVH
jgi:predicted transcriptional regulator of viral defense system